MKNKETIIGYVLLVLLLVGYMLYSTKQQEKQRIAKQEQQKTEQIQQAKEKAAKAAAIKDAQQNTGTSQAAAGGKTDSVAVNAQYGAFAGSLKGEEKLFVLENDVQKITLTSKGGQIKSVELKKYKTWDKKPLILFTDKTNSLGYQIPIENNQVVDTRDLYFEPVGEPFTVSGDSNSKSFALRLNLGEGKYFEQKFTLKGNSYMLNYDVSMVGLNGIIPGNNTFINVSWDDYLTDIERNPQQERRYTSLYFKYNKSDVSHIGENKADEEQVFDAPLEWISYKQQFFNYTLFSDKGQILKGKLKAHFAKDSMNYIEQCSSRFILPYENSNAVTYNFQYYIGPNKYNTLASVDHGFENIIKLGPDFFLFSWIKYITRFIIWVFSWFDSAHLNYGIIILLMTIILKLVLHPLTAKSIESAAKMRILAPELAALKEKYGEDQTRMSQEQMKLYNRAGVSPFGGCLPLLLQFPILIAMYNFFPSSIELRQQPFLWATDLSSYDSIVTFAHPFFSIDHISLFTLLMTITSIGQAVMNNQLNPMNNQQPGMQYMPYIMPVMLMVLFNGFPAALTYYYLLQNLLGMAHQWIIQTFFIDDAKLRKQIEENKKNPKPVSSWQKRLADMQRQNEQRMKGARK